MYPHVKGYSEGERTNEKEKHLEALYTLLQLDILSRSTSENFCNMEGWLKNL
jgi:hypothetical protein